MLTSNFLSEFYFRSDIWRHQRFQIFAWLGSNNFFWIQTAEQFRFIWYVYCVWEKSTFCKKFEFFEKFDHVISPNSVHRISSYCRVIITRCRGFELYTPHVSVWNVIGGGGTIKSRVSPLLSHQHTINYGPYFISVQDWPNRNMSLTMVLRWVFIRYLG